jgi:hypothetical protein
LASGFDWSGAVKLTISPGQGKFRPTISRVHQDHVFAAGAVAGIFDPVPMADRAEDLCRFAPLESMSAQKSIRRFNRGGIVQNAPLIRRGRRGGVRPSRWRMGATGSQKAQSHDEQDNRGATDHGNRGVRRALTGQ